MKLAIDSVIATPEAKADGFGGHGARASADMVTQVSRRVRDQERVKPDAIWSSAYLPPKADRDIVSRRSDRRSLGAAAACLHGGLFAIAPAAPPRGAA